MSLSHSHTHFLSLSAGPAKSSKGEKGKGKEKEGKGGTKDNIATGLVDEVPPRQRSRMEHLKCFLALALENGSSQGQYLVLTVFIAPNSHDSGSSLSSFKTDSVRPAATLAQALSSSLLLSSPELSDAHSP